jgi:peptidoglycan L-alanyl-D-glutamate endopeptidase CwlK
MINSRQLDDLLPVVEKKIRALIDACAAEGIDLLVTSTFRDQESQNELYAQGRTKPGKIVTNAKGGESFHNFQCAVDVVPLRNGKPVWSTSGEDGKLWNRIGEIGESVGLEWAGRWRTFREFAHFQYTAGLTLAQLKEGAQIT